MAFARLSSSRQALVGVGEQGSVRPRSGSWTAYPTVGKALKYEVSAAVMLRIADAAEDSLADILARSRFGIAIAAMIKMIATTISNSIKEKPLILRSLLLKVEAPDNHNQAIDGIRRAVLARIPEGSTVMTRFGPVKTDHVLWIAAGATRDP